MKWFVFLTGAMIVGAGFAAIVSTSGKEYRITVEGTDSYALSPDDLSALNSGSYDKLVKDGSGTLVTFGLTSFVGVIEVASGTLQADGQAGIGKRSSEYPQLVLGADATVSLGGSEEVVVRRMTLVGDASLIGTSKLTYQNYTDFDMGGHTLTIGCAEVTLQPLSILNPGNFIVTKGPFSPKVKMDHGSDHVITLRNSGQFSMWNNKLKEDGTAYYPMNWKLRVENVLDNNLYMRSSTSRSRYDGPIEISEGCIATIASTDYVSMTGDITGKGQLLSKGCELHLSGQNSWEGRLTVSAGNVYSDVRGSLPARWGKNISFGTDAITVYLMPKSAAQPDGWTAEEIVGAVGRAPEYVAARTAIYCDDVNGVMPNGVFTFDPMQAENGNFRRLFGVGRRGRVTLSANFVNSPGFYFQNDTNETVELVLTDGGGGRHSLGEAQFHSGKTTFEDMGYVYMGSSSMKIGAKKGLCPAELLLSGTTTVVHEGPKNASSFIGVGMYPGFVGQGTSSRGVLQIGEGVTVTNRILVGIGTAPGFAGAVYQRGGTVYSTAQAGSDAYVGAALTDDAGRAYTDAAGANGYYELGGGLLQVTGYWLFGRDRNGVGMLYQKGGKLAVTGNSLIIGQGGVGVFYQKGGEFNSSTDFRIGDATYLKDDAATGGSASVTIAGSNTLMEVSSDRQIYLGGRFDADSSFNLKEGATVAAAVISRANVTAGYKQPLSGHRAFLNFDGGVVKVLSSNSTFGGDFGASGDYSLTRVTLYSHGGVIDTNGFDADIRVALEGPEGLGVTSVSLPTKGLEKLIAPPLVTISGNGTSASAVCEFDSVSRTVTGITVTSPGFGYSGTATATLTGGGLTAPVETAVTLGAIAGGPLVKRGMGTLVLRKANTWAGGTKIEGGTMDLYSGSSALFDGRPLELAAGAKIVFRNDQRAIAPSSFCGAGEIVGSALTIPAGKWKLRSAELAVNAGVHAELGITLASDIIVTVDDESGLPERSVAIASSDIAIDGSLPTLDESLQKTHRLAFSPDRRKLFLRKQQGLLVIMR